MVEGSNPFSRSKNSGMSSSGVVRQPADPKLRVEGSNPFSRSDKKPPSASWRIGAFLIDTARPRPACGRDVEIKKKRRESGAFCLKASRSGNAEPEARQSRLCEDFLIRVRKVERAGRKKNAAKAALFV